MSGKLAKTYGSGGKGQFRAEGAGTTHIGEPTQDMMMNLASKFF